MALKCGIVGLPNVGKSTLFNALSAAKAEASNYPFCTIEPNVGIVNVPDEKLGKLAEIFRPEKVTPAATQFVDIAGIVKGASKGEGLGNQFLAHIREVDAIIHLVRCFVNDEVVHVAGAVDPESDIDVIKTELLLADLQSVEKKLVKEKSASKSGNKAILKNVEVLEKVKAHLDGGAPIRSLELEPLERPIVENLFLLTMKPVLYVGNSTGQPVEKENEQKVKSVAESEGALFLSLDCGLESEIAVLEGDEKDEYLKGMGLEEAGLNRLIRTAFSLLGLITYYTAGPKEVRAWTIKNGTKAPQAAGAIHSDFEKDLSAQNVIALRISFGWDRNINCAKLD